jgi:hypothetical protein
MLLLLLLVESEGGHLLLMSLEASRETCIEAIERFSSIHGLELLLLLEHHLHVLLLLGIHHRHASHVLLHGVCLHHLRLSCHEAVEIRHELRLVFSWSLRRLLLSASDLDWLLRLGEGQIKASK